MDGGGSRLVTAASEGCYEAGRAAALSGVPKSTLYYWARTGVVLPSVSPVREKLFIWLSNGAVNATEFFRIPSNRVVELGTQIEI